MLTILNPVASPKESTDVLMPLMKDITGKTFGILSNHWKSMDRMALRMQHQLKEVYKVADVRFYYVPINGAMSAAVKESAISDCDAVIVGLAN
ncbi:MAG: hypothetical protein WCH96_10530 [Betaproteobacteria bacterium]